MLRDDRDAIKNLLANSANAVREANQLLVDNRAGISELITNGASLAKEAKVTLTKVNNGLGDGRAVATLLADASGTLKTAQNTMTTLTPSAQTLMTDATRVTNIITEQRIDKAIDAADHRFLTPRVDANLRGKPAIVAVGPELAPGLGFEGEILLARQTAQRLAEKLGARRGLG